MAFTDAVFDGRAVLEGVTDLAIETSWGEALGTVLAHGATRPLGGTAAA